jgi:hypothetical protein
MIRILAARLALLALAGVTACAAPSDLDLSLTRPTAQRRYVVTLLPPATPAAVNQMHSWQVKLDTPAGAPVVGARIAVDGGMPQHGHGLPTTPRVTRELAEGTYLLEGMKFSMTGWWEIRLAITGAEGADQVTFNTIVGTAPASR